MIDIGLKESHYRVLKEKYGVDEEQFDKMLQEDGEELDDLFDKLVCEEVDDKLIEEIVDAISDYCNA